jgi:hypothetical protein
MKRIYLFLCHYNMSETCLCSCDYYFHLSGCIYFVLFYSKKQLYDEFNEEAKPLRSTIAAPLFGIVQLICENAFFREIMNEWKYFLNCF